MMNRHSDGLPWQVPVFLLPGLIPGIIMCTGRVFLIPVHQFIPVPGLRWKGDGRNAIKACVLSTADPELTPGQEEAAI